jgi:hypothetical protein
MQSGLAKQLIKYALKTNVAWTDAPNCGPHCTLLGLSAADTRDAKATYVAEKANGDRHTGVPDRYLDLGLVWKLDLHRVFLGIHNVLYWVDNRYVRNRRALGAISLFALLVFHSTLLEQPLRDLS